MDGIKGTDYSGDMIGFLVKKTFFDLWDNLFRIALINLGFIASTAIPLFVPQLLESVPALSLAVLGIGIVWCLIYLAMAAFSLTAVSDCGSFEFRDFLTRVKPACLAGLGMAGGVCLLMLVMLAIRFYVSMISLTGLLLAATVFWLTAVGVLSFQFFLPVCARLNRTVFKIIGKCFLIFFDNPLFCIFSFLSCVIILGLSVFTALLFPGPAGVLLYLDEALRLRLLKYDWLEANPGSNRRRIPWDALLAEERERVGRRSLKNLIFPWKD
ncbi:MAG: hypothetical protein LBD24_08810 [Spirochaetaceae bacterium]|nr:hypothetical protein [Spirochaetaceae bacterium]